MIDDATATAAECPTCRAPLAADQRYCVYCGTRAPQTRLEFADTLRADAVLPPRPVAVAERAGVSAVPVLAVVVALGVGALLGHWATASSRPAAAVTPATQVIRVTGDPAPAATVAPAAASATATATPTAEATATPAKADPGPTKDLSKDSIKKAVKKKSPISTGGTPPPKDNKAPGGGSDFETIG